MYRKWAALACVMFMVTAVLPGMVSAGSTNTGIDYVAAVGISEPKSGYGVRGTIDYASMSDSESKDGSGSAELAAEVGDTKEWMGLNDYTGYYEFKDYMLRASGENAEIWVATDLTWPEGDPRNTPIVTDLQVQYLLNQVDENIYDKMTAFYTEPDVHDGSNSLLVGWGYFPEGYFDGEKMVILVDNVRDENYYDSSYPIYIGGFYSPSFEAYFDRNVITIDCHDWANRMGADVAKPFLYEGIIAHEMQHLLHDDVDSDEETFVNEGLADFAMLVCGYGPAVNNHLGDAALYAENSLVAWEDQGGLESLADYGQAYLWTLYLYEQFGTRFIKALFNNPDNGIIGIEGTLKKFHIHKDFADLYHDFSIAMLIDSKYAGKQYMFKAVDFKIDMGTYEDPNLETFSSPGAPAWGTDYIWIKSVVKPRVMLSFDGADYITHGTKWTSEGGMLYSGGGDLQDKWAIFEGVGGGALTFDTEYAIEAYWDFGFVQVSADGGKTWTSLANEFTVGDYDPSAHPTVIANLPGLTGEQTTPVTMSFDLSAYAGQNILLAFRYVTDWATTEAGWYIDNVYLNGELVSDGTDASVFKDITEIIPIENDFSVTLVAKRVVWGVPIYKIIDLKINDKNEKGSIELSELMRWATSVVMLVTYKAAPGVTEYADYSYSISYKK